MVTSSYRSIIDDEIDVKDHESVAPPRSVIFDDDEDVSEPAELPLSKRRKWSKWHESSVCAPCRRHHLSCNDQRPCSRCLSNGVEDTCVDVQHEAGSNPSLRDEGLSMDDTVEKQSLVSDVSMEPPVPFTERPMKGHVASACMPCKRVHLRCDSQQPCSRCLSNGKEDTCVDSQHKARGRPRLQDERKSMSENIGQSYSANEASMSLSLVAVPSGAPTRPMPTPEESIIGLDLSRKSSIASIDSFTFSAVSLSSASTVTGEHGAAERLFDFLSTQGWLKTVSREAL